MHFVNLFLTKKKKITGETKGEVREVADMHQRKAEMAKSSDAFIALPGKYYLFNLFLFFYITINIIFEKFKTFLIIHLRKPCH